MYSMRVALRNVQEWFGARLQHLQCIINEYTAALHQAIDLDFNSLCGVRVDSFFSSSLWDQLFVKGLHI